MKSKHRLKRVFWDIQFKKRPRCFAKKKQQQQKSKWIITIKEEFNSFEQQKQKLNCARSVAAYSQHVVFEVVWNEVFIIAILVVSKDLSLSFNIYTAY